MSNRNLYLNIEYALLPISVLGSEIVKDLLVNKVEAFYFEQQVHSQHLQHLHLLFILFSQINLVFALTLKLSKVTLVTGK